MARVLIVDDEPDLRLVLRMSFEEHGFEVVEAADGSEALVHYDGADAMVLDLRLPGIDGYEVMRRLPQPHPKPVVVISGATDPEVSATALTLGCRHLLFKPFDMDDVVGMVRQLLP